MFLCSIFLRLPTLLSTTQAYEQKHKNNDCHFVIIGSPYWDRNSNRVYQFTPMQSGKPSLAKDKKCFEDLKRKNSPQELMEIMKKKKLTESYCDLL